MHGRKAQLKSKYWNSFECFLIKLPNDNQDKYPGKTFLVSWMNLMTRIAKYKISRSVTLTAFTCTGNNLISKSIFYELLWAGQSWTYIKNKTK